MAKIKIFPKRSSQAPRFESENIRRPKKKIWHKPLRTILAGFVLFNILAIGYFAVEQQLKLRELESEIGALLHQKESLNQQREMLKMQLESAEQDEMVERIARERLGLIRPGEKILILKEEN